MDDPKRVEALAAVLLASWKAQGGLHLPLETDRADAIEDVTRLLDSPAMRDLLAEAKADALREAADAVAPELANEVHGHTSTHSVRMWLRERARATANAYRETTTGGSS